jgi:hypothetical protein
VEEKNLKDVKILKRSTEAVIKSVERVKLKEDVNCFSILTTMITEINK